MDNNPVTKAEYEGRKDVCDERFARDKERISSIEENLSTISSLVTKMAQLQTASTEKTEDQEKRIRTLEQRGGKWFDKIVDVVLGAAIMYMLSKSFGF